MKARGQNPNGGKERARRRPAKIEGRAIAARGRLCFDGINSPTLYLSVFLVPWRTGV